MNTCNNNKNGCVVVTSPHVPIKINGEELISSSSPNFLSHSDCENLTEKQNLIINDMENQNENMQQRNFFVTLARESPTHLLNINEESDSTTYGSINCVDTDICKDSSDTESYSSYVTDGIATIDVLDFEYEVGESSSSDKGLYSDGDDSSSGTDEIVFHAATTARAYVTLMSKNVPLHWSSEFADTEDETSSSESYDYELSKEDYWTCVKCKNTSNNPKCRYCEKCYQIRKSHFPPRPRNYRTREQRRKRRTPSTDSDTLSLKSIEEDIPPAKKLKRRSFEEVIKNGNIVKKRKFKFSNSNSAESEDSNISSTDDEKDDCSINSINKSTNNKSNYSSNNKKLCDKNLYLTDIDLFRAKISSQLLRDSGISSAQSSQEIPGTSSGTSICSADEQYKLSIKNLKNLSDIKKRLDVRKIADVKPISDKKNLSDCTLSDDFEEHDLLELQKNIIQCDESENMKSHNFNINPTEISINLPCSSKTNLNIVDNNYSEISHISKLVSNNFNYDDETLPFPPASDIDTLKYNTLSFNKLDVKKNEPISSTQTESCGTSESEIALNIPCSSKSNLNILSRHFSEIPQINKSISSNNNYDNNETLPFRAASDIGTVKYKPITLKKIELKKNEPPTSNPQDESCIICLSEPKNCVFAHSKYVCSLCCYKCAKRIWSKNGRCPICNCPVRNIMKLFVH